MRKIKEIAKTDPVARYTLPVGITWRGSVYTREDMSDIVSILNFISEIYYPHY